MQSKEQEAQELINAVKSYQNGDSAAFDTIYQLSSRYLYVCIQKVLGNEEESRDVLQETYMDIATSLADLERAEAFLAWARVIANRKCYAHIRKNQNEVPVDTKDEIFESVGIDEEFIPENVMQDREKQRLIREIIDGLSSMQRLCVISYYYEGKKQEEIAQELDIPLNSVKSHLLRAKAKIKEEVLAMEREQGTRLYSVAPLLVLLLNEDAAQCVLPESLHGMIMAQVNLHAEASAGAEVSGLAGKAIRAKLMFGIAAAVAVLGGSTFLFFRGNIGRQPSAGGGTSAMSTAEESAVAVQETVQMAFGENNAVETSMADQIPDDQIPEETGTEETGTEEQTQQETQDEVVFEAVLDFSEYESFGRARGNAIPVKKDGLWGAVNYQKEEIVPCEYMGFSTAPDNTGTFILSNFEYGEYGEKLRTFYIFDREGKLLYESSADDSFVSISGGMYIVATTMDDGNSIPLGRVSYYKADGTLIFSETCDVFAMRTNGFRDGYAAVATVYENESETVEMLGKMDRDGNVTWYTKRVDPYGDNVMMIPMTPVNSFNHGYSILNNPWSGTGDMIVISDNFETFAEFNLYHYQLQGDTLVYAEDYYNEETSWKTYLIDGSFYANYGTKMVLVFGDKNVLVDLSLYPGMTYENADGRILQAVYDDIVMSEETYWLAADGDQSGYIDHDGNKIKFYDDASEFCQGRALVIEEGVAYLIDENFEKLKEVGEAESVACLGDFFLVENGESKQLYPVNGNLN